MPNYILPQEKTPPEAPKAANTALASAFFLGAMLLALVFISQKPGCSSDYDISPVPTKATWGVVVAELKAPDADTVLILEELDKATDAQGTKLLVVDDDTPLGAEWAKLAQEHGASPPLIMSFDADGNVVAATELNGNNAEQLLEKVGLWNP